MSRHDSGRHQPGSGESPNPLEGHILPGISLQEAMEVNELHHVHNRHYHIITLISYMYTLYVYDIVYLYRIVFDIDDVVHDFLYDSLPDV